MQSASKLKQSNNQTFLSSVVLIQKQWKRYFYRKQYLQKLKKNKRKNFTAFEILQSQRSYCEQLNFVIKSIMVPSISLIADQEIHKTLFNNIQEIHCLHNNFLLHLESYMKEFNTHLTCISEALLKNLFNLDDFKKCYTVYCENYKKTDQTIKFLMDNNAPFKDHLKTLGIVPTSQSFSSYMIKPVQRLCKYKLLIGQYFKNMEPYHKDYERINESINIISKLVRQTNEEVEQFLMRERYVEIKAFYNSLLLKIPKDSGQKRKLLYQTENIAIINLAKEQDLFYKEMFMFNDCLLFISHNHKAIEEHVIIKYLFFRDLQNYKYFKNMVQVINAEQQILVKFKDEKGKKSLLQITEKENTWQKSPTYLNYIKVNILGTEVRQGFCSNYTVYIIQIFDNGKTCIMYPRFTDLLKIQNYILKKSIKVNFTPLQKQSRYATFKSKTIEKRKLQIQQFLERVLNREDKSIRIQGLSELLSGLDQICSHNSASQQQDYLIILLPNLQKMKLKMCIKCSKVRDLKNLLVSNLNLETSGQFEIFEVRNKNLSSKKLLYEDESLSKIYEEQKNATSSINPFRDTLDYIYTRHYYLNTDEEYDLYKNDPIRSELELSVIHSELQNYKLDEETLLTFICLFSMYIHLAVHEKDQLQHFLKQISKKYPNRILEEEFLTYYEQIEQTVQQQVDEINITIPLLCIKIMSNAKSSRYQCIQFEVEIHSKSFPYIKRIYPLLVEEEKIIFTLGRDIIYLLSCRDKTILYEVEYIGLEIVQKHPNGIIFRIEAVTEYFRIKTAQVFQIVSLVEIYQADYMKQRASNK